MTLATSGGLASLRHSAAGRVTLIAALWDFSGDANKAPLEVLERTVTGLSLLPLGPPDDKRIANCPAIERNAQRSLSAQP